MTDKATRSTSFAPHVDVSERLFVSRLLAEFYVVNDRPVAAFDLADEGPQLTDYLPSITTIADMADTRGQMIFFDRLVADDVDAENRRSQPSSVQELLHCRARDTLF